MSVQAPQFAFPPTCSSHRFFPSPHPTSCSYTTSADLDVTQSSCHLTPHGAPSRFEPTWLQTARFIHFT
ncbi:hypothetical protein CC80DRAFT_490444 [Byssothecium circinans]|uniref:Uncharacterized protein n=1 Tax=Byssothecium circinans TaxID=147558 RepID=A0A6A5U2Q5_9PLEO|nr:hypothetical protein CC80DRAFT_490444 [Byssothecium circinans]